ncbi:uncharacterized protein GGS22DRAFT_159019 [Annulohypoxylon maeteangense]|uniref:uncharacterized protein n=1 Tax=Annulohypoxylon maeteangense TaxID=1927788 RepID=UPI002008525D|nr:uncharacterized protein GGS22DRAFT_159019 [Annulohypoxylon maeteangense]KAI0886944.1 hypothetical protein GGS22DRAFT_159019 [Annulohypoxylon maeteangense]
MQQVLPFVQVRDLPSAASFYSSITQPLKLRYISANASSVVYGDTTTGVPKPVLEVRRAGSGQSLRPSRVVLSAQSPQILAAFRAAAIRADPDLPIETDGRSRVELTDYDGNRIEVVCSGGDEYPRSYGRSATSSIAPREPRAPGIRRSATISAMETPSRESPRSGGGMGAGLGTLLGAAAAGVAVGGALTYAMLRNDRQQVPYQDYESQSYAPSSYPRRGSLQDPPSHQPRYIEDSPSKKYPPVSYGRYAQLEAPPPRSRAPDDDGRTSHYGAGSRGRRSSEAGSVRRPLMIADGEYMSTTGSRNGLGQRLLMDHEYRSQVDGDDRRSYAPSKAPSKYTASPSKAPSKYREAESTYRSRDSSKARAPRPVEAETYVSARTARSASTVRPPAQAPMYGRAGRSRANSYVSARESRASWEDWDDDEEEDDNVSLAPSDSISCIDDDERSRRNHRRGSQAGAPSAVGRYRKVVNEFDGKRKPKYGSEYNYQ